MSSVAGGEKCVQPILAAVNFEPPASAALRFAARLAAETGAPLKILHVVHEPAERPNYYGRLSGPDVTVPMEILAGRLLDEFLRNLDVQGPALDSLESADVMLVKGLPATRIPEVARKSAAGQIVMGHTGPHGLFGGLFSSLSDRVADRCDIPVTVIHPDGSRAAQVKSSRDPFTGDMALGT